MKKRILLATLIFSLGLMGACGGRLPSAQTSQKVLQKHFKKYGKKYREGDFGQHKVSRIEVASIEEVQKGLSSVEAFVYLAEGGAVYRVRSTLEKKAFGWRHQSWENLGKR